MSFSRIMNRLQPAAKRMASFSQTNLGAALAGAGVGGMIGYGLNYTNVSVERDHAVKNLDYATELNNQLLTQNTAFSTTTATLTQQIAGLNSENATLRDALTNCKQDYNRCKTDIDLIKTLHANSYLFKPKIDHVGKNHDSKITAEEKNVIQPRANV